jgi:hypothetical protein
VLPAPGRWTEGHDRPTRRRGRGPAPDRGGFDGTHDEGDARLPGHFGERLEQEAAPRLVAFGGPPAQHERVDAVGVRVPGEQLEQEVAVAHDEAGEVERVHASFAWHAFVNPRRE